jgi:hypothetical protein
MSKQKEFQMIELGSKVKDSITGFSGIATGRAEYLHGVPRVLVEATQLTADGKTESNWIDEPRLVVEKAG